MDAIVEIIDSSIEIVSVSNTKVTARYIIELETANTNAADAYHIGAEMDNAISYLNEQIATHMWRAISREDMDGCAEIPRITHLLNPYTEITVVDFDTPTDKLHAMGMDDGWNLMRVGDCGTDDVDYWIYRTGEDEYTLECRTAHPRTGLRKHKGLTAEQVVELVGDHNIMVHETFEAATTTRMC